MAQGKQQGNFEFVNFVLLSNTMPESISEAAQSGDGTVENVGIRTKAAIPCPDCRQKFDTQKAKDLHWKFIHDPNSTRKIENSRMILKSGREGISCRPSVF